MNKPNPPVNRQSQMSIETTPTMRRKAHAISRCFISIMKIFRVFKCSKKKHKTTKIWQGLGPFRPSRNFTWFTCRLLLRTGKLLLEPLLYGGPARGRLTHRLAVRYGLLSGLREFFTGLSYVIEPVMAHRDGLIGFHYLQLGAVIYNYYHHDNRSGCFSEDANPRFEP